MPEAHHPAAAWLTELMLNDSFERRRAAADWLFKLPFEEMLRNLQMHNLTIRGLQRLVELAPPDVRLDMERELLSAFAQQKIRLKVLRETAACFQNAGVLYVVQKTLDNWPDFGTDIDILISGPPDPGVWRKVIEASFPQGHWKPTRKLCERMARKWTYQIPSLCDLEIHFGCIGQVGEHRAYPVLVTERRLEWICDGVHAYVPTFEDRFLLVVLQRLYRHFQFRVCDLINWISWVKETPLDWDYIWRTAESMGVRPGVERHLSYLVGIADKMEAAQYAAPLVEQLRICGQPKRYLTFGPNFYRLPFFRDPAFLYGAKLRHDLARGRIASAARVSLVFPLGLLTYFSNVLFRDDPIW